MMNLVVKIQKMVIKEIQFLCLWILLHFAYQLTILKYLAKLIPSF